MSPAPDFDMDKVVKRYFDWNKYIKHHTKVFLLIVVLLMVVAIAVNSTGMIQVAR
ncbi:MAG TPA: hypothetical protein VHP14_21650 [Anaerolineales bacterium]|nr:hypothetical protein [Anaerolineales bacterium]